uniref:Uncharacterized protein n=1 Tax=Romanomermis culicivorax TaxID=13658 RepID=A0A915JY98_ROMCU
MPKFLIKRYPTCSTNI